MTEIKEWRQFELLISRLETTLNPLGYIFKSPDKLIDYDINDLREVDCSIRYKEGDIEKVISIECRKRQSKEDVTWIEQLACKMKSLKLSGTIAVSSQGFSKAARIKAEKHDITLRTYSEVEVKMVTEKFNDFLTINHIERKWKLLEIKFETCKEYPTLSESVLAQFNENIEKNTIHAQILANTKTGEIMNLTQMVEDCLSKFPNLQPGKSTKTYSVVFEPNLITVPGFPSGIFLKSLELKIELEIASKMLDGMKLGKYLHEDNILMEVASGNAESERRGKFHVEFFYKTTKIRDSYV